jgi:hypothetical protein
MTADSRHGLNMVCNTMFVPGLDLSTSCPECDEVVF